MVELRIPSRLATSILIALVAGVLSAPAFATPSSAAKDTRPVLAFLSLQAGTGFAASEAEAVESLLLSAMEETNRFRVIGRRDIQTLLDLEAKKQTVGCKADDACMVSIAGALGADFVASADLEKLGRTMVLVVRVIHVRTATVLVHARQTVESQDELVHAVDLVAHQTVSALAALTDAPPPTPVRIAGIVATVVGGIALAAGTGLGIAAQVQGSAARSGPPTSPVQTRVNNLNGLVTGSVIGWAGGGAIAATGVGLLVAF